ncbi:MAG: hypothetical protein ACRDEA_13470 [Microcystaceae cyanobacterium]
MSKPRLIISPKFKLVTAQGLEKQPLGEILQQANLVSATQIEEALIEQAQLQERRIGEILAERGWLKQETADFFAEKWMHLVLQHKAKQAKQPLGYYLQEAALLDENQISAIISEQGQGRLWIRLGTLAVLKGWLKQSTVDFFVENLFPEHAEDSPFLKANARKR